MKFHSTRGKELVSGAEAITNGIAKDGGLYVPEYIPTVDYKEFVNLDYVTLASKILSLYFTDFSYEEINTELKAAYLKFDIENVVELKKCDNSYFLELFHGPTLAFKDLALVCLPRLMVLARKKLGIKQKTTILTATSGDTGGAALSGFKDVDGISIVVLYPNNGVSSVQERQMLSFDSKNAKVIAVNGNFDDCQSFVKQFFMNNKDLSLSSANSINIARLVPQIVYYFYSYYNLVKTNEITLGEEINFSVPTGNFGNILAGYMAKMMGLPIGKLFCASNKNDVLTDYFNTGIYNRNREFFKTNSPSMDILISSNLERFLYYITNQNEETVSLLMSDLSRNGRYQFNFDNNIIKAYKTDESYTLNIIKEVYDKYNYLIDPHTAVAYNAYVNLGLNSKTVVVSTASPFKFPQAILEAFGQKVEDSFSNVKLVSEKFNLDIPNALHYKEGKRDIEDLDNLNDYIRGVIKCFK